jgi:hypothetical protein
VRRKAPKDVLLSPNLAEIQAIGIEIAQPAQGALAHQGAHFDEGGMVLEEMADHEHEAPLLRLSDESGTFRVAQGERLFHEDMLAGLKRLHDHSGVLFGRRRNRNGIDCRISQRLGPTQGLHLVFCRAFRGDARARIDHCRQGPEPSKFAHQIDAPVATAGDRDARRTHCILLQLSHWPLRNN